MNVNLKSGVTLFFAILFGAVAMFFGFAPYAWVCEYVKMTTSNSCNISHGLVFAVAVGFFALSIMSYRQFAVKDIFLGKGE
jgi:hypothetical protein